MNDFNASKGIRNKNNRAVLNFARAYLKEGFPIIPLGRDKQPLFLSWMDFRPRRARATLKEVVQWLDRWPEMQLGMAMGRDALLIAVHVKEGGDLSRWPATVCAQADDGGTNLFFWHPGNTYSDRMGAIRVWSAENVFPLTDIIGDDGYVDLPQSGKYRWIKAPKDIDYAEVPHEDLHLIVDDPSGRLVGPAHHLPAS